MTITGLLLCLIKLRVSNCQQEGLFYTPRYLNRLRALWGAPQGAQNGSNVKPREAVDHPFGKSVPVQADRRPGSGNERIW